MRINLTVPFKDKDQVRRLGARWDLARRTWYVENVENLEPFLPWIPAHLKKPTVCPPSANKRLYRKST